MELSPSWDSERLDPLAVAYFSVPGAGLPPKPTLDGMTARVAKAVEIAAPNAWRLAGDWLGADFALEAFQMAERLGREAPGLLSSGRALTWARAIAWVIARRPEVADVSATRLAHDLGSTPATMRHKAEAVRSALRLG